MINVEKIVTISLMNREDRRIIVKKELSKLNLQTEFFLTEPDKENRERGCFDSHVAVARHALREGCQSILIFEDDIKILPFSQNQMDAINQFISKPARFDLLYLGLILGKIWYCGTKSIVRARGACLHGYLLSKSGMEKMANYQFTGLAIDEVVKQDLKCYSVYPMIAEQYPETVMPSAITSFRNQRKNRRLKDDQFWKKNYINQKRRLWGNFHRTIKDLFCFNL